MKADAAKPAQAFISDIQRCCFDDGDGLRTTVFFKGCNLHCPWCHNPETISARPVLMYAASRCVGCGVCAHNCKSALPLPFGGETDCAAADGCRGCLCPQDALRVSGRKMTLEEIMSTVYEDIPFYRASGGGVTLSGGEPLLWPEMCGRIAKECRKMGIPVLLDTAGCVKREVFAFVAPLTDMVYMDMKLLPKDYDKVCGNAGDYEKNLDFLMEKNIPFVLRVPVIPGFSADPGTAEEMAEYAKNRGIGAVQLLPFNPLARSKYEQLGRKYPFTEGFMKESELNGILDIWRRFCPETVLKN